MSFGRWLLVHSFSLFLLTLFIFGYIYRTELQLEVAYSQLLNVDNPTIPVVASTEKKESQNEIDKQTESIVKIPDQQAPVEDSKSSVQQSSSPLKPLPTVSTVPTEKIKPDNLSTGRKQLFMARQAYWDKNYADSIYLYRQLIQQNSENPDYLGELGNVYYSLNDTENASKLYYQSAIILMNQNQPERAELLIAPIIAMNRQLGEKLRSVLHR